MYNTSEYDRSKVFNNVKAIIEESQVFFFNDHFVTVFTTRYFNAMRDLTGQQRAVFDCLVTRIKRHNICRAPRTEIAATCGIKVGAVSKAITALKQAGVIYKHHDGVFEIDPSLMWYGKREEWFQHSSPPNSKTHRAVEVVDADKPLRTLWYPIVPANPQNQRTAISGKTALRASSNQKPIFDDRDRENDT